MDITTVTTLLLIVVSPAKEVTPIDMPIFIETHEACMKYLADPIPELDIGWSGNWSCLTESGVFAELPADDYAEGMEVSQ